MDYWFDGLLIQLFADRLVIEFVQILIGPLSSLLQLLIHWSTEFHFSAQSCQLTSECTLGSYAYQAIYWPFSKFDGISIFPWFMNHIVDFRTLRRCAYRVVYPQCDHTFLSMWSHLELLPPKLLVTLNESQVRALAITIDLWVNASTAELFLDKELTNSKDW